MRLGATLRRQHIDRWFKKKWEVASQRKVVDTGAKEFLQAKGINVADPQDLLNVEYREKQRVETIADGGIDPAVLPKSHPKDKSHPNWHDEVCFSYTRQSDLVGKLEQAQNLTHSLVFKNQLPFQTSVNKDLTFEHDQVQKAVMYSKLFDAHQEKLPKRKDPNRLYWNFARDYGIPKSRANQTLIHKFLEICDKTYTFSERKPIPVHLFPGVTVHSSLRHGADLLQFSVETSYLLTAAKALQPIASPDQVSQTVSESLPSIYPLKHTVALKQENVYELQDSLAVGSLGDQLVHTAFLYQDKPDDAVLETGEAEAHALTQSFAVAVAQAKKLYGDVERLPSPLVLNCVHTDGKHYLFGVFQLNHMKPNVNDTSAPKNLFWFQDPVPLFDVCELQAGKPVLEGYNPVVFKNLLNMYSSGF